MAPRTTQKPTGPKAVQTVLEPMPEALADLAEAWHRYYRSALAEIVAVRHRATATDRQMLIPATLALHGEAAARAMAAKALAQGQADTYLECTKLAQSEARTARATLASLGLTGSKRALAEVRRK